MKLIETLNALSPLLGLTFIISLLTSAVLGAILIRWIDRRLLLRVKAKQVMTPNEQEFYRRLKEALPDYEVLAQVAMGSLLTQTVEEGHPDFWRIRRQFAQKIVDYVIMQPGGTGLVAVIELDDRTHDPKKDARRDALLASAGITTLRFESRAKPSKAEIRRRVEEIAARAPLQSSLD